MASTLSISVSSAAYPLSANASRKPRCLRAEAATFASAYSYRRRSRIEIMFGRLKDWRRVATRYDRCPTVFFSAIALAATVIFWL